MDAAVPANLRRKIQWNADILLRMLRQIKARRNTEEKQGLDVRRRASVTDIDLVGGSSRAHDQTVLDEVKEIIVLPEFNAEAAKHDEDPSKIELPEHIVDQMREYVTVVASLYHRELL